MFKSLKTLFLEDQKDRISCVDFKIIVKNDRERRKLANVFLRNKEELTPEEIYYAAMFFHHSANKKDVKKARDLMLLNIRRSEFLKRKNKWVEKSKWLYAAATDRLLVRDGKPQKYGTQFYQKTIDSPRELFEYDKNTTDKERTSLHVPTLKQTLRNLERMDRKQQQDKKEKGR
ncbi:MAG: hypothetical protein UU88_C0013G0010 [Parcubacteria group bacterium GW2011_GWC1_42_11]|uniref:Uncharacterized protein n=1 Tax=Candidatus Nomurabacteria bacterium GW2011_GWC2_42_20 TaxID=1618756 RepID=A0A0G0ZDV4_9BACT|nr:MAG: hypothetical protein UU88_C0013G0010 [Parcubacteria group bacterium GW2011_GWC1_42_11]KKS46912.1 MAG: hypothetical protein UV12_C0015G0006 [Candidatus Nomurabacteria bacterium GW2011_GWC2_42_20]KKS58917.1 MAG: hypothetical protein UV24_C0012G0004 [Candidatus Nomurabacteria bacterium GW2011_GWA2_42_41]KKT08129.1 MAG: hypothetical protein UV86_C0023G0004 [Candidatus Nomurabacteria bacterium GW2011_GWB1_43_20]HBH71294.1 hypothetical protein [Candidatus Yonathbacteria bacterium]